MKKFLLSFYYAGRGIKDCFKSERNFKVHTLAAIAAVIFSVIFKISPTEWLFIVMSIVSVTVTEMINTIAEKTADYIEPEKNEAVRFIKDMAAGMVLITAIGAFTVGAVIFIPKIF